MTTYGGLLDLCARAQGKRPRPRIGVPLLSPGLSSHWIGLVTPVDAGVARPLVEGLTTETVVEDPSGMELFDVEPTPLDEAMRDRRRRALLSPRPQGSQSCSCSSAGRCDREVGGHAAQRAGVVELEAEGVDRPRPASRPSASA